MVEPENYFAFFPCGLKFALKKHSSPVAYCALSVQSGTSNEPDQYNGLAHLTEHMLFKGTEKRGATSINNRLEMLGGELNAYTTKEETVVYSTVLGEDLAKAVDLMLELVFKSLFEERELKKEKSVVADEINLFKDSPSDYIFDDFEEILFKGSCFSKPVLGSIASLRKINSGVMKSYVRENFTPDRMSLAVVGDFEFEKVLKIVTSALKKYVPECGVPVLQKPVPVLHDTSGMLEFGTVFNKSVVKKNHQANCILGSSAYSIYYPRRMPLILLTNILGGPASNSRLNTILREATAMVYGVDVSYTQYSRTGVVMIYFGCDKNNVDKCIVLINKELERMRNVRMSDRALKAAKKQLMGQLAVAADSGETQVLSMGKSLLAFSDIMPDDEVRRRIEAVTADDIIDTAREIFAPERISTLIYK